MQLQPQPGQWPTHQIRLGSGRECTVFVELHGGGIIIEQIDTLIAGVIRHFIDLGQYDVILTIESNVHGHIG